MEPFDLLPPLRMGPCVALRAQILRELPSTPLSCKLALWIAPLGVEEDEARKKC